MKSETAQTLFFSDAVALSSTGSRDDNVTLPDATMATPASEYEGCLLTFAGKDLLFNKSCIFESFVCHFL